MTTAIDVPRFRSARRLVQWMERNWTRFIQAGSPLRLPPESERCFFRNHKENPREVATCIARYAHWAGRLGPELESLLLEERDSIAVYVHEIVLKDHEVPQSLLDALSGDARNLFRVSNDIGRLPDHLERTIDDPRYAFLYSKEVLRGRLPRHLEDVFYKEPYWAAKYAFEVIRGFAPVRLPDELHTFMIMKSFEDPENEHIKAYMEASESDPNIVGNTEVRVR